jgi:hypothetical protein
MRSLIGLFPADGVHVLAAWQSSPWGFPAPRENREWTARAAGKSATLIPGDDGLVISMIVFHYFFNRD